MSEAVREKKLPGFRKYKPYPAYKDSGVEWLGEVPAHWEVKKIKHTTYVKGRIGWQNLRTEEFVDEGVLCITGTDFNVNSGMVNFKEAYRVSEERYNQDPYIQLKENDLLITKDGSIGKVALVKGLHEKATLNSGIFVTRPLNKNYLQEYMYWVLNSIVFTSFINYLSSGTTIKHLYQNIFQEFVYPLPDYNEQMSISFFLDRETAKIDALIAKQVRLIELLQEKRTALITRAVTKGLDPDVPMKDSGVEWLGEIPAHWEVLPLKRRFEVRLGKMLQNEPKSSHDEYLPYLRAVNITWKGVDTSDINRMWFSPREKQLYDLQKYDLLVSEGGDVGRSALWQGEIENCYIQNAVNRVRSLGNDKTVFLYYWMFMLKHIGYIDMLCSKATIGHFTAEKVEKILVIFPPPKEQQLIIEVLDKEISKINKLIDRIEKAIDIIKEYRTALISAAVTGKIDVRREVP